ncbi:ATP-dependent DNA helicase DinG [Salicibibacter cibarius]|uniref:3'-5' exonuclease DinG n=1 Tax=Salicibibacter cibarius TaxID=2743000 RepID=A0A7T6Z3E5_9BACI|nr:ATP-dependent DNA helicase DinG [Salicibibacter cibarius]QQK76041.1 ATP-dependent DNA helicase DinG [Salicibibacter cibarius]
MNIDKPNKFIVIDVETTGNRPRDGDRIIEIGLAVVDNGQVMKTFSSFVSCDRQIPSFVSRLTGITENDIIDAPSFSELAPSILEDLDGACLVAHHIDFDLQFLNNELVAAGYEAFRGHMLDTVEMARMLYPALDGYRLPSLAEQFNLSHENPHRAGSDAEVTAHLLLLMLKKMYTLPHVTLQQLEACTSDMYKGLQLCVYDAMKMARTRHQKNDSAYDIYQDFALKKQTDTRTEPKASIAFNAENFFGTNGALASVSSSFEHRNGQVDMSDHVYACFADAKHLIAEAATGTGKTLAYLYPAVSKSREKNRPVVIATETVALQQQIKDRDVPLLEKGLDLPIEATVLKGRSHYLCLQKFAHFLEQIRGTRQASYDEQLSTAQILIWLTETETGDVEELNLPNGGYALWDELKSDPESCTHSNCTFFSRCFYPRAKDNARQADIIITNHALLFTDHFQGTRTLPAYDYLVVDEAHHLEEAAGRHLGATISYQHFMRLYNQFGVQEHAGLFADISVLIDRHFTVVSADWLRERKQELQSLHHEWNQLFIALQSAIVKKDKRQKSDVYIPEDVVNAHVFDVWKRTEAGGSDVIRAWRSFIRTFKKEALVPAEETLLQKVNTLCNDLEEAQKTLASLLTSEEKNEVYWAESDANKRPDRLRLYRRPINISEQLADEFFSNTKSIVLTSATLTVKGSFQYTIDQLGLTNAQPECLQLPSPFQYEKQAQLLVPEDFPEIRQDGEERFTEAAAHFLCSLTSRVNGRMLVLFTSHQMVKDVSQMIKPHMQDLNYSLFAQGVSGDNRSKLVKQFRSHERSILMGTTTFWEGIDLPGEDVRALIIVRLPFAPPDDPVYMAKAKQIEADGGSAFSRLALPRAVLRFKQGFGRLIRTKRDRGLVFVLDKRLIQARYGKVFLRSLPTLPSLFAPSEQLLARAEEFYHGGKRP